MSDSLTVTELRARLYRVIDEVLATGVPRLIRRGDRTVSIQADAAAGGLRLDRLPRRQAIACTPDELVEQGFAGDWTGVL